MPQLPFFRFLTVLLVLSTGTAFSQSLADVLSSIQERQRAVEQSRQVSEYLASLNGGTPMISDQELIAWTGLESVDFPDESDLSTIGIDGRVALLNQAVTEFKRVQRSYFNLRSEDLAAAAHLGALRPFMREDFLDLGRADASTYHTVLSQLAQDVVRLRVLPWPVAGIPQNKYFIINKHEETTNSSTYPYHVTGVKVSDDSTPYSGWAEPAQLGPCVVDGDPNTSWSSTTAGGILSEVFYTYNTFNSRDYNDSSYGPYTLRFLNASLSFTSYSDAMIPAAVPGERTDQIGGKVALLSHNLWTPAKTTDYVGSDGWNNQDSGFLVEAAVSDSTGAVTLADPPIKVKLEWFDSGGSTSRRGLPSGFSDYKHNILGGTTADWLKSWEKFSFDDLRDPIVLHRHLMGVAAPSFVKGLNSGTKLASLESSAKYSRPPSGDAVPVLNPAPGILLGIPIGVGVNGNTGGWIGWSPSDIMFHGTPASEMPGFYANSANTLLYPFDVAFSTRLIRFDHAANLRFIGPAQDFNVVYETSRTARGASLPATVPTSGESSASGWDGSNGLDDSVYPPAWKNHFFAAWDAPRLRQVISRDFLVDVTFTGHYSSEIKIYRRSGTVIRTPGQLETPVAANLVRTLVCSNPAAGTNALPAMAERIDMIDGSNKYEVWRDGLETSFSPSTQAMHFQMTEGSTVRWTRNIEFPTGLDAKITTTLDAAPSLVDEISGAWPAGEISGGGHLGWNWWKNRTPLSFKRTSDGKVIQITNTIDEESPGSQLGGYPATSLVKYPDQPDLSLAWKSSGLLDFSEQGTWRTDYSNSSGGLIAETKLGGFTGPKTSVVWMDWSDGERKVKTYSSPVGNGSKGGPETSWSEIEYGNSTGTGLPGLPHIVRNSDGTGTTCEWAWVAPSNVDQLTLSQGSLPGNTVTRGTRIIQGVNEWGHSTGSESYLISGTTLQTAGSVLSDFNAWGMPGNSADHNTGLGSAWTYSGKLSRLATATSPLGITTTFGGYDAFDRVGNVAANGISAAITHTGFGSSASITGNATGSISDNRDGLGRSLGSNTTWNEVHDDITITPGSSSTDITRETQLGTYQSSVRTADGSTSSASGPTIPFGGNDGTNLSVEDGLLKTTTTLLDSEGTPTDTLTTTWTDAWGRVRNTTTSSGDTQFLYSDPTSTLQRTLTTEPSGRKLITESDPYDSSGSITRSGIDVDGSGTLGTGDRYIQSTTTTSSSGLVTTLKLTDASGLREILRTTWTPSGNVTETKINGNEETITTTPNYTTKTVTTTSTKGWSKTESFNNLGLTTSSSLSGAATPSADLTPTWRADGALSGVSLTIDGQTHAATFKNDGTLNTLTGPNGNIPVTHSISGGTENLTVDGLSISQKLDGTQLSTSGGDTLGKTDELTTTIGGFNLATTPAIGAATNVAINAAGAPTAKSYAAGVGESRQYLPGGLLEKITLARGGDLTFGYSDDGAKDLTSATWPTVASGPFTLPSILQTYGYDRAGRINAIGDSSGARSLIYQNGRLASTTYTSGTLSGYKLIKGIDSAGRETGFDLYRGNALIHTEQKNPNGVSGEISMISSGSFTASYGRDAAHNITSITRGPVTQTWTRNAGRITAASSNCPAAPTFTYPSFDAKGRREKCTTAGGDWTYTYTNSQLASAIHPTLGSFSYQSDAIGRRTDKGSANTTDLLNRTLAWTNTQNKTLKINAAPAAHVWVGIGTATPAQIPNFTGTYNYSIPSPGAAGGWVAWSTLAVLTGQGDPGANADAKAEQSGAVWVPPVSESFTYDAAGNRESSALWDYGWNAKNELVRSRTKNHTTAAQGDDVNNAYDAEGRRFQKKVNRYQYGGIVEKNIITFIHDGKGLIYERHQLSSGLTTLERKYVWGPDIAGGNAGGAGGLLLIIETKGNVTTNLYPLYDGSGNIVALTDASGNLVGEYAYGPFGELIYARGPKADSCPFRFQTKYLDQETGLYNFGKRFLDPITGQWLSREPLGESESINLYSYTGNDPINNVDRLGLEAVPIDATLNNGIPTMIYQEWAGSGLAYLWNAMAAGKVKTWNQAPDGGQLRRCFYFENGRWELRSPEGRRDIYMDEALAAIPAEMEKIGPYLDAAPVIAVSAGLLPVLGTAEVGIGIYGYGTSLLGNAWVQGGIALAGTQAAYEIATDEGVRQDTIGAIASDPNGVRATGELLGAGVSGLARMGPRVASLWETVSDGLFPSYGRVGFQRGSVINPFFQKELSSIKTTGNYRARYVTADPRLPNGWPVHHTIPQKYQTLFEDIGVDIGSLEYLRGSEFFSVKTLKWIGAG